MLFGTSPTAVVFLFASICFFVDKWQFKNANETKSSQMLNQHAVDVILIQHIYLQDYLPILVITTKKPD